MGGLAGHMMHIYDNRELRAKDITRMLMNLGRMSITEKVDGFNIMILKNKSGQFALARNKSDIENDGFSLEDIETRWAGKDHVLKVYRMVANCIEQFSDTDERMLNRTDTEIDCFNCEVLLDNGQVTNVMPYFTKGRNLIIHDVRTYDLNKKEFTRISSYRDNGGYKMSGNPLHIKGHLPLVEYFCKDIEQLLGTGTINDYYINIVSNLLKTPKHTMPECKAIVDRIFGGASALSIKEIKEQFPNILNIVQDKEFCSYITFKCKQELDRMFTNFANALPVTGYINEDRELQVENIILKQMLDTRNAINNNFHLEVKYKNEYERFDKAGCVIKAYEGLVFEFEGNIYKLTGSFACINQICGLKYRI